MKLEKNKKYLTIAVYAFFVIAAAMIFFFILLTPQKFIGGINKILSILAPLIIGFLIAFILNPVMNFFENIVFKSVAKKKPESKRRRALSLICTYIVFLGILTLFVMMVVPSLVTSITDLINNIEGYYNSGVKFVEETLKNFNIPAKIIDPLNDFGDKMIDYVVDTMKAMLPRIYGIAVSTTSTIKNIVIGFAFSIYMLASKELFARQCKKVITTFTKQKTQDRIFRVARLSYSSFSSFLSGYLVDSLAVGIICYIVMLIFGWPYPSLISVIIGISNMIPFFGPFIGAIPSVLLIFMVNPWQALFFTIFIIVLQQIDGNFICPKILGQKVGLSSFWVMVAIVVGGSVFGIAGMILSVPAFAVIYTLARSYLDRKNREKLTVSAKEKFEQVLDQDQ